MVVDWIGKERCTERLRRKGILVLRQQKLIVLAWRVKEVVQLGLKVAGRQNNYLLTIL